MGLFQALRGVSVDCELEMQTALLQDGLVESKLQNVLPGELVAFRARSPLHLSVIAIS